MAGSRVFPQFIHGKDSFFISVTKLNSLKVWDVTKPASENIVCEIEHNLDAKVTSFAIFLDDDQFLGAVGFENGKIVIWDLTTAEKVSEYHPHKMAISGICFRGSKTVISACKGRKLVQWDVSGFKVLSSVKMTFIITQICSLPEDIICAGTQIEALHPQTLKRRRHFQGHAQLVTHLVVCPDKKSFMTASEDRYINFWKLKGSSKKNISAKRILQCDAPIVSLSLSEEENKLKVAVVTQKGDCLIWNIESNKKKSKSTPISPSQKVCISGSSTPLNALRAVHLKDSAQMIFARGLLDQPTFYPLTLTSEKKITIDSSPAKPSTSKKRKREDDYEVVDAPTSKTQGISKQQAKRVKLSPLQPLEASTPDRTRAPVVGSIHSLVSQAIATKDEVLFHEILQPKKSEVIRETVTRLNTSDASTLLSTLCSLFRRQHRRASEILPWIEHLVKIHGLHMNKTTMQGLTTAIEEKMDYLVPLLKLQGKVDLLIEQKTTTNSALEAKVRYIE